MVFNVHYNKDGDIVSYQEGPTQNKGNDIPDGCKCLSFEGIPQGFFNPYTLYVDMKVDVKAGKLMPKREAPAPLPAED